MRMRCESWSNKWRLALKQYEKYADLMYGRAAWNGHPIPDRSIRDIVPEGEC